MLMQNMSKLTLFKDVKHCKFLLTLLNPLSHNTSAIILNTN